MATVAEFIAIRQQIESVVDQVTVLTEQRKAFDSSEKLQKAGELLETLKTMADNDVQENCVVRLTTALAGLRSKAKSAPRTKRAAKRQPAV
jgi:hypothetical protein